MNNKGFTIVELIVSFTLASIIVVLLFQLVLNLKEIQEYSDVKTKLLTKQSNISSKLNKNIYQKGISKIEECQDIPNYCLEFTFNDNSNSKLIVDKANQTITIDDNKFNLVEGSSIDNVQADVFIDPTIKDKNNSILTLNIEIKHEYFKNQNFGIYLVYQYNNAEADISYLNFG